MRTLLLLACTAGTARALLTATGFVPYFNYEDDLKVEGVVGPMTFNTSTTFYFSLTGLDPECSGAPGSGNSCGIHIHANPTCLDDAGGHYYNATTVAEDPWSSVTYMTNADGAANGMFTVNTGYLEAATTGKSMIIHDYAGARIACAILGYVDGDALFAEGFVDYVDYTHGTDFNVSGTVGPIISNTSDTQTFYFSLSGVDPLCTVGASNGTGNSCGIHFHSGSSCTEAAGGHFYDSDDVSVDPWGADKNMVYEAADDGTTEGSLTVQTGYDIADVVGREMIIHAYDGKKIACAIIGSAFQGVLTATGFVPYYTYTGDMAVGGVVGPMTSDGTTQTFYFSLTGVDPLCATNQGDTGNKCGIHVHEGTSCAGDAGGHYYTGTVESDPWGASNGMVYTSTAEGTATGTLTVDTGAPAQWVEGRTMIVHDATGGKIACALLTTAASTSPAAPLMASGFVKYYGGSTAFAVGGSVGPMAEYTTGDGTLGVDFYYDLIGVDPACSSGPNTDISNSCGLHIHTERTCTAGAGGHYHELAADPWGAGYYTAGTGSAGSGEFASGAFAAEDAASGTLMVPTGATLSEANGRAMIVHDHSGNKIACAILGAAKPFEMIAHSWVPYLGYDGSLAAGGWLTLTPSEATEQCFYYSLSGVDPACSGGAGDAANSCGIHIHQGMSCAEQAGGHYYTGSVADDPWGDIAYTSTDAGIASVGEAAKVCVTTGGVSSSILGRAMIVHNYEGAKIGCALLTTGDFPSPPPSAPPKPPPTPPPPSSPTPSPPPAYTVEAVVTAEGSVSDYSEAVTTAMEAQVATELGVDVEAVTVTVVAASVHITIAVSYASDEAASAGVATMAEKMESTETTATFLSTSKKPVTVESIDTAPTLMVGGVVAPFAPPPPASPPKKKSNGGMIGGIIGGMSGLWFGIMGGIYYHKKKSSGAPKWAEKQAGAQLKANDANMA